MSMEEKNIPIRVGQVVGKVVTGGVDVIIMNYYRNLDKQKVQFDFIMSGLEETPLDQEILSLGGQVHKVENCRKNLFKSIIQYYRIFRENDYDIVHSNLNSLNVFPLAAAWLAGTKIRISHSHSTSTKGEGIKAFAKLILRPFSKVFATHYFSCSEQAGRWLFGDYTFNKGKVTLINNAIDVNNFDYNEAIRKRTRQKLGLSNEQLVVGHIGRFVYQKNHDFLLDIFAEIHKMNTDSALILIGDGELRPYIQKKVQCMNLSNSLLFLGVRQDVPDLLQAIDIFVFPSQYEGFGIVAVEAQAAGLQTLVADTLPQEVRITDSLEFFSLSSSALHWANKAISMSKLPRNNSNFEIKSAGYDISNAAKTLEKLYFNLL